MEIWKDIFGYKGLYQISNFGRVKSLPQKTTTVNHGECWTSERILKIHLDNKERPYVVLKVDLGGKRKAKKKMKISRLMKLANLPKPQKITLTKSKPQKISLPTSVSPEQLERIKQLYNNQKVEDKLFYKKPENESCYSVIQTDVRHNPTL